MDQSRVVREVAPVDRQHRQTQTPSAGQAGPLGLRYLPQAVEVEQVGPQPDRTGPQGRHHPAGPGRAVEVDLATQRAQAAQAVTVGSGLVAVAVVVASLVA